MGRLKNKQVVELWVEGRGKLVNDISNHSNTLYSAGSGQLLYSYGSHFILAEWKEGNVFVNGRKFSTTTSAHQGLVRRELSKQGIPQYTLFQFPLWHEKASIEDAIRGHRDMLLPLQTSKATGHIQLKKDLSATITMLQTILAATEWDKEGYVKVSR